MRKIVSFEGYEFVNENIVRINFDDENIKEPLSLFLDVLNKSPTGFSWGYSGSGPHQLAFAILLRYTQNKKFALEYYPDFVDSHICKLPQDDRWIITVDQIDEFILDCKME